MKTAPEDLRNWRKSSHSGGGNGACVEVRWRKSSYSDGGNGSCVEIAFDETVWVRDSKNVSGPNLAFPPTAWQTFTHTVA